MNECDRPICIIRREALKDLQWLFNKFSEEYPKEWKSFCLKYKLELIKGYRSPESPDKKEVG